MQQLTVSQILNGQVALDKLYMHGLAATIMV